jgi:hypothetical protein
MGFSRQGAFVTWGSVATEKLRAAGKEESPISSSRSHADFRSASSGSLADYDFYVPAKRVEKIHQAFHGESIQAVIRQSGYLGLIYFQYL